MPEQSRIDAPVVAAVEEIVRREMAPFGLLHVSVSAAEDHDGDPILLIDTEYGPEGQPIEPKVVAGLVTKVRNRLWDLGETRFPHIHHHFSDFQKVAG